MDYQGAQNDASPELTKSGAWLCFTGDIEAEQAEKRFAERFGQAPGYLIDDHNLLWVGPAPEGTISP